SSFLSGVQLAAVKGVCVGVIKAKGKVEGATVQDVRPRGFAVFSLPVQENIVSVLNLRHQWIAAVICQIRADLPGGITGFLREAIDKNLGGLVNRERMPGIAGLNLFQNGIILEGKNNTGCSIAVAAVGVIRGNLAAG